MILFNTWQIIVKASLLAFVTVSCLSKSGINLSRISRPRVPIFALVKRALKSSSAVANQDLAHTSG